VLIPSPTNHSPPSLENLDEKQNKKYFIYPDIRRIFSPVFAQDLIATYEKWLVEDGITRQK
jgi:hypothetical protein